MITPAIKKHLIKEDLLRTPSMDMDITRLRPMRGQFLGILNKEAAISKGGIEIPEFARRTKHEVTIITLGESDDENPWPEGFKPGAVVITRPYGGRETEFNRKMYLFLKLEEVEALIEEETD